ncbi:hypothetical protein K440DRAFT_583302 [Wilcoxina mikolae CBS 423.85]|nr:hypothetical protein K440DRAFT_583302 [Wilcoxina mikolae CBS 423.85]
MFTIQKTFLLAFTLLNLGLAQALGTQFITGACTTDTDCASACCGFKSGKCAAPIVAQERDGGCGFGNATPNDPTGRGKANPSNTNNGVNANNGKNNAATPAPGKQFITGACTADADCASACCGFNSGKCAGPVIAQERDGGCGFGNAKPNNNAAKQLNGRAYKEM